MAGQNLNTKLANQTTQSTPQIRETSGGLCAILGVTGDYVSRL
jgi:hypothetical protein